MKLAAESELVNLALDEQHQLALAIAKEQLQKGAVDKSVLIGNAVLTENPHCLAAKLLLATAHLTANDCEQAMAQVQSAYAQAPEERRVVFDYAVIATEYQDYAKAQSLYQQLLAQNPDDLEVINNLGHLYYLMESYDEGCALLEGALAKHPESSDIKLNLAALYRVALEPERAMALLQPVLAREPDNAAAHYNLGCCYGELRKDSEAIACFEQALALEPGHENARWSRGHTYLKLGEFEKGWLDYDDPILVAQNRRASPYTFPQWQGESLADKTLLIVGEQGVGDEIIYASTIPDAIKQAKKVIVEVDTRLVSLYERSFPGAEIVGRCQQSHAAPLLQHPDIDVQCLLFSLNHYLRPNLAAFPTHKQYLSPDPEQVTSWQQWLDGLDDKPKVGVAWRTGTHFARMRRHNVDICDLEAVLTTPGVTFIAIQYGKTDEEIKRAEAEFNITIHQPPLDLFNDLDGSCALFSVLDLAIAAFNSTAFMAAAVGTPAWALNYAAHCIKSYSASNVPFSPGLIFFHQSRPGDWDSALAELGAAFKGRYGDG